ncbi:MULTISPECIES: restriction endonuclease subunit S [unclassified Mesorhizobium]|uniref:restriction endonuclease subunit S n=1 Tax=unclassified Mesorhizobium TaxID=325217 RepID=UPI000F751244|nr:MULTISPECIES: restriction endonuclease subunit S [unclassified Mesorhizobium]AZO65124.1 restriction endonuclease subunit S [Mesorhizobium sp. M6A.T.Cr.TU.016.01.1.1]RWP51350.1 MAG: restriction endonuclease subunit S [Mesorhizobium sp.]RWQ82712.1 MAG: restriction endonuclease subunit S [Mesorhizobium sp.]
MTMHVARLDDVCEINPRMPKSISDDDIAAFLPMAAVSEDGLIDFEEKRPVREVKRGYTYFERGDVLVAKITPCFENGKAARTSELTRPFGFGSTEFHVLRAGKEVDPSYLFHLIWNSKFREVGANNMTGSAGQKRVPTDFLKRLEIPLPPLPEQRRIAAILDKADALRRKRKRAIELLDSLTQSIFKEMFGGQSRQIYAPITELADLQVGFAFKSSEYTDASDGVKLCRGTNVLPGEIDWSDLAKWPKTRAGEFSSFELRVGDVVVAMDRPWISSGFKVAQLTESDVPSLLVQRVARLRARQKTDRAYLLAIVTSTEFSQHLKPTETTVPHISPIEIRQYAAPIPSDRERASFSAAISKVDGMRLRTRNAIEEAVSLFSSLQSRAFSGRL